MAKTTIAALEEYVDDVDRRLRGAMALIEEQKLAIIALEQRSSNFAVRMNATHKVYRAEIARLRDLVETPKPAVAASDRISRPAFDAALKLLQEETGVKFHAPSVIRGRALKMSEDAAPTPPVEQPAGQLDF